MTEITLDKSDKAINELIGSWKDGQTYEVKLKQVSTDGNMVTFEAEDMSEPEPDAGDTSQEDMSEGEQPMPAKHKNPALMVLIGGHKQ